MTKRIKVTKDGPFFVTGGIPLTEMEVIRVETKHGSHLELKKRQVFEQKEEYALCRCGKSSNPPYCDGSHIRTFFKGLETADRRPYLKRLTDECTTGLTMDLLDDGRCAYARFCHLERGNVWELTEEDFDEGNRKEAIKGASDCPSGRLTIVDKSGKVLNEPYTEPEIFIVQDPEQDCSAGIFVRGPIIIEAEDSFEYEQRDRVCLCRCGKSENKPFCDAAHVSWEYKDGMK